MKDIHGERPTPGRIPVISPILHCIVMTALVYLRTSFGITLLRPRSIFFALSVAVAVLDYIAWHELEIWREYGILCIFCGGAVVLYWMHFAITFIRELAKNGEHDAYPGTSHALRISGLSELNVHLWLEPAAVLLIAGILRYRLQEQHLSAWLLIVAPCMWIAEALNYWTAIRLGKIAGDITADADERGKELSAGKAETAAPLATRVAGTKLKRNRTANPEVGDEARFAKLLGITEPYDLEEAETKYRILIQGHHPDDPGNSEGSNAALAELNEAIAIFRNKGVTIRSDRRR